jgi:hypothetical protein
VRHSGTSRREKATPVLQWRARFKKRGSGSGMMCSRTPRIFRESNFLTAIVQEVSWVDDYTKSFEDEMELFPAVSASRTIISSTSFTPHGGVPLHIVEAEVSADSFGRPPPECPLPLSTTSIRCCQRGKMEGSQVKRGVVLIYLNHCTLLRAVSKWHQSHSSQLPQAKPKPTSSHASLASYGLSPRQTRP